MSEQTDSVDTVPAGLGASGPGGASAPRRTAALRTWEDESDDVRLPPIALVLSAVLMVPAGYGVYERHYTPMWAVLGYATIAGFIAVFAVVFVHAHRHHRAGRQVPCAQRRTGFIVLSVSAAGVVVVAGEAGVVVWFALSQASLMLMPRREAWAVIGSICVCVVVVPPSLGLEWDVNLWFLVGILGSAWATDSIFRLRQTNRRLLGAQEQIASMAVEQERLRFARDLHDLLGHSLTAATMKAQLAQRVADVDLARARTEMRDVEALLREALGDVRAAVAGYRDVTLAGEAVRAAAMLNAAGIDARMPGAVDVVTGARREVFGWVLREAVTNVIRHSRASACAVEVSADSITVWNDGADAPAGARDGSDIPNSTGAGTRGSGLAGLRERVESSGGRFTAGPDGHGGWLVRASMEVVPVV